MKAKIEDWLDDNRFYWTDGSLKKDGTGEPISACDIHQCLQDLAPQWVSVADGLPKENKTYIVYTIEDGVFELGFFRCPEYVNFAWYCPVTKDEVVLTVTHWQPLPEPPRTTTLIP